MTVTANPSPPRWKHKRDPATVYEVALWLLNAARHEVQTGLGAFLTRKPRDFRAIGGIADSFEMDDIPDDPLRCSLVVSLHSGQQFRISIEEV